MTTGDLVADRAVDRGNAGAAGDRRKALWVLGAFAGVLAYLSSRHEVYGDEAQAWLISRDSKTILEMIGHLRYEGHPALWYLLLYIPSHLGAKFVWTRVLNYAFSVGLAGLIISEKRLPMRLRILAISGVYVAFHMGLLARSYTLSALLLVGAVRCFRSDRPKHWFGVALVCLSINCHFLAIPAAIAVFVWVYWCAPDMNLQGSVMRLREKRFWTSAALMALAVLCCYLTVRPAPNGATPGYILPGNTVADYMIITVGRLWSYVTPFIPEMMSGANRERFLPMSHPSWIAASVTMAYGAAIFVALPGKLSRWFFVSGTVLWLAAVMVSIHTPSQHHASTLFAILLIAVMLGSGSADDKPILSARMARFILTCFFGAMTVLAGEYLLLENFQMFSSAESTGDWLQEHGLLAKPLIFAPDHDASVILAEKNIKSAFFASCDCRGSFVVFDNRRNEERQVTVDQIKRVWSEYGEAPIVLTRWKIKPEDLSEAHISLLHTPEHGFFWPYEDLYVYGLQASEPNIR